MPPWGTLGLGTRPRHDWPAHRCRRMRKATRARASPALTGSRLLFERQAENAVLRHQLIVLKRRLHGRVRLTNHDHWFFIQLYRWFPSILKVVTIIQPRRLCVGTGAGFRCYWRWKSRPRGGRPARVDPADERRKSALGHASTANCSSSGLRSRSRASPSTWSNDRSPQPGMANLLAQPRAGHLPPWICSLFQLRFRPALCLHHRPARPQRPPLDQRHSKSDGRMVARQITEAFPWDEAPHYLIRDRDWIYGSVVTRRLRAMGIRDKPTAPASPWQNGFAERLVGSIRRECVDHMIVLGEVHLRRTLKSYAHYYSGVRTHRSSNKDAPVSRSVQRTGVISSRAILGGLHHHYGRI